MLWWFYTAGLAASSVPENLPLLGIYQNHKLHLRLTQQNICDSSTPHCERPCGKHKPTSKQNHLQSFRQDTRSARAAGAAGLLLHQGKRSSSRRELLTSRSTGEVSCLASLFPVFQEFFSFHNGAKSGMLIWALPENIPKEMELNNTTALKLQQQVSHGQTQRTGGKRHHNVKSFLLPRVKSGYRNMFLLVLSYRSLQEGKKIQILFGHSWLGLQDSHNCLTWPCTEKKIPKKASGFDINQLSLQPG